MEQLTQHKERIISTASKTTATVSEVASTAGLARCEEVRSIELFLEQNPE